MGMLICESRDSFHCVEAKQRGRCWHSLIRFRFQCGDLIYFDSPFGLEAEWSGRRLDWPIQHFGWKTCGTRCLRGGIFRWAGGLTIEPRAGCVGLGDGSFGFGLDESGRRLGGFGLRDQSFGLRPEALSCGPGRLAARLKWCIGRQTSEKPRFWSIKFGWYVVIGMWYVGKDPSRSDFNSKSQTPHTTNYIPHTRKRNVKKIHPQR